MPWSCFSYPADVPPGTGTRDDAQSASPSLRTMPYSCFSYSVDAPLGVRNHNAAQPGERPYVVSAAFPGYPCFRY